MPHKSKKEKIIGIDVICFLGMGWNGTLRLSFLESFKCPNIQDTPCRHIGNMDSMEI
jgi:hypothetical protein